MRSLKRNITSVDGERCDSVDSDGAAAAACSISAMLVSLLPPSQQKDRSAMHPPLQPPPKKRATAKQTKSAHCATAGASPQRHSSPPATPPPSGDHGSGRRGRGGCGGGPTLPTSAPMSPPRLLIPRVSWSEIISQTTQLPQDDDITDTGVGGSSSSRNSSMPSRPQLSPQTPLPKCRRQPSPLPQRGDKWRRRRRPPSDDEHADMHQQNEGRFAREFADVSVIGSGQFSTVYRAKHRIDQCSYAVKKTTQISKKSQHTEVFALASVAIEAANCPNIVRYFSSWLEDGRLHIQTELCECSLRDLLSERRRLEPADPRFQIVDLAKVLLHVASGLSLLHGKSYAHLDIKPDNILMSQGVYKIADLGLAVAALGSGCDDISEGDCRYLAKEVLRGDLSDLPRADVFSLGLVCYELATNPKALPCSGEDWQRLRDGVLDASLVSQLPSDALELLRNMVDVSPAKRPLCEEIIKHPCVSPTDGLEAMQEKMRQQTLEAERYRRAADEYFQEMLSMKRQELLNGSTKIASPDRSCTAATPAGGASGAVVATEALPSQLETASMTSVLPTGMQGDRVGVAGSCGPLVAAHKIGGGSVPMVRRGRTF
eukprot:TRINITY_DN67821_c0_g1_i1.p1 TRINITY_DN67821_c0_g1~~TRINITY_DN67821_c0_g1_i1.p1  ORF type:complete len:600 (-),score=109.74 TRINITY_DN67821_c0_g1_i1:171-1970(-)